MQSSFDGFPSARRRLGPGRAPEAHLILHPPPGGKGKRMEQGSVRERSTTEGGTPPWGSIFVRSRVLVRGRKASPAGPCLPPRLEGSLHAAGVPVRLGHFAAWCGGRNASSLPAVPETVALYLVSLAVTHRPATITRRLTSIARKAHAAAGHPNPATTTHIVVAETLQGIRRTLGTLNRVRRRS